MRITPRRAAATCGGIFAPVNEMMPHWGPLRWLLMSTGALLLAQPAAVAGPPVPPAPLPPPSGAVINVSTVAQLQNAVGSIASNTTIVIAPGTYALTSPLYINGSFTNVGIRGATGNRDDVVLVGKGMGAPSDGGVPFGIWVGGNVAGVTIADLTIRDVYNHPIILNAGTQSPLIHNVRLVNAGQQFIKSNPDGAGGGVDNGTVEYSVIEYDTTSRDDYTNGVDVHTADNWIVRHNLFRNIRAPQGQLAGPAILMWSGSTTSVVEGNPFVNCQREIAIGLIERTPNDHTGGIVRNNFIYRNVPGDVAISIADSPNTQVLHNSILISHTYANATVTGNYTSATSTLFVNAAAGDLHVVPTAMALLSQVSTVLANATVDWDGDPRPAGSTDIGADE
jgi:hypothetical protein